MCLTWQIVQTLMRRRIMLRLIWVYAICKCSLCCPPPFRRKARGKSIWLSVSPPPFSFPDNSSYSFHQIKLILGRQLTIMGSSAIRLYANSIVTELLPFYKLNYLDLFGTMDSHYTICFVKIDSLILQSLPLA